MKQDSSRIEPSQFCLKNLLISVFAIAIFSLNFISPALATGVFDLPSPNTEDVWVVDVANEISLDTQNKLSSQFKDLAAKTGQELRMVAIRRLDYGETINSLADEIFATWYPEPSAQENQTLLVMDTLTNTTAIRTGAKAAELVNSEMIQSVIQDTVGYNLRAGNKYNQALLDSRDRLLAVLSGETDPGPAAVEEEVQVEGTFTKAEDTDAGFAWTWVIVLLLLATVIPMVTYFWYVM
jgi:uncharacterized protein